MPIHIELIIFVLFFAKHYLVDFAFQTEKMLKTKDTYVNKHAILHAFQHGVGTFLSIIFFTEYKLAFGLATLDFFVHFHIDYFKVRISKDFGVIYPDQKMYWVLFGCDQFLHVLTYIYIFIVVASYH